jgi:hypothetical protein
MYIFVDSTYSKSTTDSCNTHSLSSKRHKRVFPHDSSPKESPSCSSSDSGGDSDSYETLDSATLKREEQLATIISRWCTDDDGLSVVETPDGRDRYPNFTLYRMIARTVHNHIPIDQLDDPLFQPFLLEGDAGDEGLNIYRMHI